MAAPINELLESDEVTPAIDRAFPVKVEAAGVSAFDLIYRRWGRLPGVRRCPLPWVRTSWA